MSAPSRDEAIDAYVDLGTEIALVSSPRTQAILFRHGGAVSRIADDATAAGHRGAASMAHPIAAWHDPAQTELHLRLGPAVLGGDGPVHYGRVYLNFEPDKGEERVRAGYGAEKYASWWRSRTSGILTTSSGSTRTSSPAAR
jgi:hypothetical protein